MSTKRQASSPPPDEIPTQEAMVLLGYTDRASISILVKQGKLTPSRKLPGRTGAFLFLRSDVEALATEIRARLEERLAGMDAAKAEVLS